MVKKYERKTKKDIPDKKGISPKKDAKPKEAAPPKAEPDKPDIGGQTDRRGAPPGQFGNPPHVPTDKTRAMVKGFIIAGTVHEKIAEYMEISHDTLTRHYKRELGLSLEELKHELAGVMMRRARDDNHKDCQRAAEYIMNRRGGDAWKEATKHEHTGAGGGPIETRMLPATNQWLEEHFGGGEKTPPSVSGED